MKTRIINPVVVSPVPSGGFWEPMRWRVERPFSLSVCGLMVTIPEGSLMDFASVPRILKPIFPDRALYGSASAVHDRLYYTGEVTRWMADAVFYEVLREERLPWITAATMWLGVRMGGWVAWGNHRRAGHHA